jgi:hypothetical protein
MDKTTTTGDRTHTHAFMFSNNREIDKMKNENQTKQSGNSFCF